MRALALAFLLAGPASANDAALEAIKAQLAPFVTLKGDFEQTKKIRVIKRPLVSQGSFILAKDRGLLWRTAEPMVSTLRISRGDIAVVKDGRTTVIVSMKRQPGLRVISTVLFAVFAADVEELKRHFEFVRAESSPDGWAAELKPRDAGVAKAVSRIEIRGRRAVDELTLFEANGDRTGIRFSGVTGNAALSKEEEALFELEL